MFGSRRSSDTGRSTGFVASAALVGLVALGLVVVLVYALVSRHSTPAAPTAAGAGPTSAAASKAPASAAPASSTDGERPAGCATTGTDQTVPTSTPAAVTWTLLARAAVPSTAADGPKLRTPAGVGYCYSHTPIGALLAASNIGHGTGSPQAQQDEALRCCVVPNQYSAQAAKQPMEPESPSQDIAQLKGFRFITYSPTQASITLASNSVAAPDQYSALTFALQWYRGDWRLVPQPGPSIVVTGGAVPNLDSFVPWAGV